MQIEEDFTARLERLNALHKAGTLTDEEFGSAKATVLDALQRKPDAPRPAAAPAPTKPSSIWV